jgi:AraC family transcriptional activator of pyochelin receptor
MSNLEIRLIGNSTSAKIRLPGFLDKVQEPSPSVASSILSRQNESMDWRIACATQLAQNNYADGGLSLKTISGQVGISAHYLGRVFRKRTGKSFHQYLHELRMERARTLLCDPLLLTVQQVAYLVGYDDPSNFCRAFRGTYRTSPRVFFLATQFARISARVESVAC